MVSEPAGRAGGSAAGLEGRYTYDTQRTSFRGAARLGQHDSVFVSAVEPPPLTSGLCSYVEPSLFPRGKSRLSWWATLSLCR